jgi:hypothetical protein
MFGAFGRGSRRRGLAAAATALAAMALAAAVAGRGCDVSASGPAEAVRDFAQASSAGDRKAVFDMLSPQTQAQLVEEARLATSQAGSAVRYEALDLISLCTGEECLVQREFITKEVEGDRAVVEVVHASGERAQIGLVRTGGRWRVDLPEYGTGM